MLGGRRSIVLSLTFSAVMAAPFGTGYADERELPEYYFHNSRQSTCVLKMDIADRDLALRSRSFISFLGTAYTLTEHWHREFVVAGVDYVAFRHFFLVMFSGCVESKHQLANLESRMPKDVHQGGGETSSSPIISSWKQFLSYGSPIAEFEHVRSPEGVARCLVYAPLKARAQFFDADRALSHAWVKYRVPIFDKNWANGGVYVLFGRQCAEKRILYSRLIGFASEDNSNIRSELGKPSFFPAAGPYLDRVGGKRAVVQEKTR